MQTLPRIHSLLILLFLSTHSIFSQTTPFLTDDQIRMLENEISGDRAFEHIRVLSRYHRDSGMKGFFKAADYVMQAAKDAGLENVHFIEQTMDAPNYTARSAELWMMEPVEVKLADIADHPVMLADGSHDADIATELAWIGDAKTDSLDGIDVKGKIVLTNGSPGWAVQHACYERGAVGVVSFQTSENRNPLDVPDQICWGRIGSTPPEGKKGAFAFMLSPRRGEMLKKVLQTHDMQDIFATGRKMRGGRVVLKAKVHTEIGTTPGRTGFVEGWMKGTTYHDQQIIITAHLQEEKSSANDDGSGCASILEIARTLNKLMQDGKIPRPLRDIRFWWTDEISSEYRYFKEHPDEPKKFLANIHQDMVGANQCMGSRVQHLIFAPYSRTSYLDAIFESIGNFVILTNNSFLAASRQGGLPRPFTRPIFSALGSHDGYNARFVPYFNSSDHMTFVEGIIGVPAIATINWDDPFIHSSGDDLYQIDQTQLKRNCFIMGSTAFVLAFLDDSKLATVAEETFAQGEKRLANDFLAAMRSLGESGVCESCDARIVIEQGIERETRALNSIRSLIQADWTSREKQYFNSYLDRLLVFMKQKKQGLLNTLSTLDSTHVRINDAVIISSPQDSLVRKKIPSNPISVKAYFENRDKVRAKTDLHPLMREEVYNFVDGKRSYYDIYKAVRAEQLAAGSWYYGNVTLQDVVNLLDAAVEAKALELKQ